MAKLEVVVGARDATGAVFDQVRRSARKLRDDLSGGFGADTLITDSLVRTWARARAGLSLVSQAAAGLSAMMATLRGDIDAADAALQKLPGGLGEVYRWLKTLALEWSGLNKEIERWNKETEAADAQREAMKKVFEANATLREMERRTREHLVQEFGTPEQRAAMQYQRQIEELNALREKAMIVPGSATAEAARRVEQNAAEQYRRTVERERERQAAEQQRKQEQESERRKREEERRREELEEQQRRLEESRQRAQQRERELLRETLERGGFRRAAALVGLRGELERALREAEQRGAIPEELDALRRLYAAREADIMRQPLEAPRYSGGGVAQTMLTTRFQGYADANLPREALAEQKKANRLLEQIARNVERGIDVKGLPIRN